MQVHPLEYVDISQAKDWDESDVTSECNFKPLLGQNIPNSMSSSSLSGSPEDLHSDVSSIPYTAAVISHGMAIKCLLRGLTGSDPQFTTRWCIDNSSVTVVRHSTRKGWEIQRVNDTSHLRLL
jgi:hypothetical protein